MRFSARYYVRARAVILDWARGGGQKRTKYCRLELVLLFVFNDLRAFLIPRPSIRNVRNSTDECWAHPKIKGVDSRSVKCLATRQYRVLGGQKVLNALDQPGYALRFREHGIDSEEGCQLLVEFFGIHGHHYYPNPRQCVA